MVALWLRQGGGVGWAELPHANPKYWLSMATSHLPWDHPSNFPHHAECSCLMLGLAYRRGELLQLALGVLLVARLAVSHGANEKEARLSDG